MLKIVLLSLFAFEAILGVKDCPDIINSGVIGACAKEKGKGVKTVAYKIYECKVKNTNCPEYTVGKKGGGHPVAFKQFLHTEKEKPFKLAVGEKACTYTKDCLDRKDGNYEIKGDGTTEIIFDDGTRTVVAHRQYDDYYTSRGETFAIPSSESSDSSMIYGVMVGLMLPGLIICLCIGCLIVLGIGSICGYAIAKNTVNKNGGKGYQRVDQV